MYEVQKDVQKEVIVQNIKELLRKNDMTQSELADKIGVAKSTMSDYMNYRAKPSAGVLEKMAYIFNVSKSDIDTTYKDTSAVMIGSSIKLIRKKEYDSYDIPVIGKISAGTPLEAVEHVVDRISPPFRMYPSDELFGLVVDGESMNKIVPNGYYAILRKQPNVENGEIAAVIINGNYATLKKVYVFTNLIILEPCSHDPKFTDQQFTSNDCDDIKILGKFLYAVSPIYE